MQIIKHICLALIISSSFLIAADNAIASKIRNPKPGNTLPILKDSLETKTYSDEKGRKKTISYRGSPLTKKIGQENIDTYIYGVSRPWNCPICLHKVNMPSKGRKYTNIDADLCPHSSGNIRYSSEITICPNCGFSAFQSDFRQEQPEYVKRWVLENLQPHMKRTLHTLLGPDVKITGKKLLDVFKKQSDIPDTLRNTNAYLYYKLRYNHKDPKVREAGLARVAWLTAWAYRRAVNEPIQSAPVMNIVRRISAHIEKENIADDDVESSIRLLTKMFKDEQNYDDIDRQILRIMQAGYYNRLGLNSWALMVIKQANDAALKKYSDPASDPWLRTKAFKNIPPQEQLKALSSIRTAIAAITKRRDECLRKEVEFLGYATKLIEMALRKNEYPTKEIPTFTYLVGEFERRREQYSRSLMWLAATKQMLNPKVVLIQHYAPQQIDILKRYVRDQNITPPASSSANKDWQLLQQLAKQVIDYRAAQTGKAGVKK